MSRVLIITILSFVFVNTASGQDSLIVKSIYFGGGSYYIDWLQENEIKEFIESIEELANYEVILFSHTDNIGGKEYNEWLSMKRGEAVYNELLDNSVPPELIDIRDFSFTNPLYTNNSHLGRRANRRVDIILWPIVF